MKHIGQVYRLRSWNRWLRLRDSTDQQDRGSWSMDQGRKIQQGKLSAMESLQHSSWEIHMVLLWMRRCRMNQGDIALMLSSLGDKRTLNHTPPCSQYQHSRTHSGTSPAELHPPRRCSPRRNSSWSRASCCSTDPQEQDCTRHLHSLTPAGTRMRWIQPPKTFLPDRACTRQRWSKFQRRRGRQWWERTCSSRN